MEIMNLKLYLTLYIKINSKMFINLNVRDKTIKLLEENTEENFCDIGLGKDSLNKIPKVQMIKEKKIENGLHNLKVSLLESHC